MGGNEVQAARDERVVIDRGSAVGIGQLLVLFFDISLDPVKVFCDVKVVAISRGVDNPQPYPLPLCIIRAICRGAQLNFFALLDADCLGGIGLIVRIVFGVGRSVHFKFPGEAVYGRSLPEPTLAHDDDLDV